MDFDIGYLVGCVITFMTLVTVYMFITFIKKVEVDFLGAFVLVSTATFCSVFWFIFAPVLVLICATILLSKGIVWLSKKWRGR